MKKEASDKGKSSGRLSKRERRALAREEREGLDGLALSVSGEVPPTARCVSSSLSPSPELVPAHPPTHEGDAPPAWVRGFKADLKDDMKHAFSTDMRALLAAESRSQHEALQKQLQETVKGLQAQSDAKFAVIEARLDALEANYKRHPDDASSPRSSAGSRAAGVTSPGGSHLHTFGAPRAFDPQDPTFEMVIGGFNMDKRQDIDASLQPIYVDAELKAITQSHRCEFRDNKALVRLKVDAGDGFRSLRQKQRAFIARWKELGLKSVAPNSRDKLLWVSQNRTPEERACIRAVVLTVRFLEDLQPRLAADDKQKVELGWRRGEVWVYDQRVMQSIKVQVPTANALPIKQLNGDDSPYWVDPAKVGHCLSLTEEVVVERWRAFRD